MRRSSVLLSIALSGLGFAAIGLPDGVLGIAWPSLRSAFGLPQAALGALLAATTAGYVCASFASGAIVARIGVGPLLALSCALTGLSLLGYAAAPSWAAMVSLGTLAGLGAGAIDAGINAHAAAQHSPRVLSLLHAFYGLGTTAGPALMTGLLLAGRSWRLGYAILAAAQLALALGFALTQRLWERPRAASGEREVSEPLAASLRLPAVQLGGACFLVYTGVEAAAGAWIYSLLYEARSATMAGAGSAASAYWGGLLVGRLALAVLPPARSLAGAMQLCIAGLCAAAALLAADPWPAASAGAAALLGLAAGPIFPLLIATTPLRLARGHAANAVGIQVAAAAAGQALIPALLGLAAGAAGLEVVPLALFGASILLFAAFRALERHAPVRAAAPRIREQRVRAVS